MPSRRELIRMTDEEVGEFLEGRRVMNLASLGPGGRIHLVAMWYGFLDSSDAFRRDAGYHDAGLVIETFAKSQKVQNLHRDPRFTALVEAGETYQTLQGVEIVGAAEIIEEREVVVESCKAVLSRYESLGRDEDLQFAAEMAANKRVCVRLHVEQVVSWDHAKLDVSY